MPVTVACPSVSGHAGNIDAIPIRRMNQFRNDVIVGDNLAAAGGKKPRADRRLRRRTGFDNFDLNDMLGKLFEDFRCRPRYESRGSRMPRQRPQKHE